MIFLRVYIRFLSLLVLQYFVFIFILTARHRSFATWSLWPWNKRNCFCHWSSTWLVNLCFSKKKIHSSLYCSCFIYLLHAGWYLKLFYSYSIPPAYKRTLDKGACANIWILAHALLNDQNLLVWPTRTEYRTSVFSIWFTVLHTSYAVSHIQHCLL